MRQPIETNTSQLLLISYSRLKFEPVQKSRFLFWSSYNRITLPEWAIESGMFAGLQKDHRDLMRTGILCWAHIVQANSMLFSPGDDDHPAAVVFSPLPWYDEHLDELAELASLIFSQKGLEDPDPELAELSRIITHEHTAAYNYSIPESKTDGRAVFYTSTMVFRKHLPNGVLSQSWFPYICPTKKTKASMILPSKYWHPELVEMWQQN